MATQPKLDYEVVAVGAGFAGLGLIHFIREAGLSIRVFDKGTDIGGTWNWNRYPGAATDSEGFYYCFTFSKEVLDEWTWSERYPGWEETHRYLHFVADKYDMWPNIQLNTEIVSAEYQSDGGYWLVKSADGAETTCKYFVSAMGMISQPYVPNIKGIESFSGPCFHSSRWPQEGLDYAGKRVGIIGCGATTVQMMPVMAQTAESVTVFQRTPNFVMPAVQKPMTPEWEKEIKDNYDAIIAKCRNHVFGMAFDSPVGRNIADTDPEEVQRILEEHWPRGSFSFVFETFDDLLSNADSNKVVADFIANKVREKVDDPEVAELLVPKGYPLFAKRPPLDHGFYEAFNRDNVHLVDIKDTEPLVEIDATGIRTTKNHYEFDIIVLATGFQAYTGAQEALQIIGESGTTMKDKWEEVSASIMGVCVADFPNLFMITGPQAPFANLPTSIEQNIMWITDCIKKMESEGLEVCKPRQDAEDEWVAHTAEIHEQTLMAQGDKVNSWMMGANIAEKSPRVLIYFGGANVYYDKLRESVDNDFPEWSLLKVQAVGSGSMIDLEDASNENERLALSIFQAMDEGTLLERMPELCTEDFVWANSGLPTLYGQQAFFELARRGGFRTEIPILAEQTHFSADLLHIASNGDVVLTERVDHHWAEDGRDLMTPHIAGVIEIRDGKISALRDFYDVRCYEQEPTAINPEYTLEAHRARVARRQQREET